MMVMVMVIVIGRLGKAGNVEGEFSWGVDGSKHWLDLVGSDDNFPLLDPVSYRYLQFLQFSSLQAILIG